jgi:peptidoglycan-N-acetylglucosamine deacetylase
MLLLAVSASYSVAQEIAFTWDDLPAHGTLPPGQTRGQIARQILSAMKQANMPPAFGL